MTYLLGWTVLKLNLKNIYIYIYLSEVTNYDVCCYAHSLYLFLVYTEFWLMLVDHIYNCSLSPYDDGYQLYLLCKL